MNPTKLLAEKVAQIEIHIDENLYFWDAINLKNLSNMESVVFQGQIHRIWSIRVVVILLMTIIHQLINAETSLVPDSLYRPLGSPKPKLVAKKHTDEIEKIISATEEQNEVLGKIIFRKQSLNSDKLK